MAILKIKHYPEEVLKKPAEAIEKFDDSIEKLVGDMLETMYFFNGIGLAANQVGILKRLFVADTGQGLPDDPFVCLNPEILYGRGSAFMPEGCLSLPGISADINRPETIIVKGCSVSGKIIKREFTGLFARVIQHEIDHLNGKVFIDRVNPLRKWRLKKEYVKKNRNIIKL